MKRYFYILLVFITLISCNSHQHFSESVIDRNVVETDISSAFETQDLNIDNLIDSLYIIKLETNDNSVLSSIQQIVLGDKYIYILDNYELGSVALFYKDGRFCKRLSHGAGPGEISRALSITYDSYRNLLLVQDVNKLMVFDSEGVFLRDVYLDFIFGELIAQPDNYIFYQYDFQNLETNLPSFVVTDTSFNVINLYYINYKRYVMGNNLLSHANDNQDIVFHRPLDNNIYLLNKESSVRLKYKFVYPNFEANLDNYNDCRDNSFDRDIDLTQPGKCYFSGDFAETDNYIFMRFTKIRKGDVYVYMDKRTKAIYGGLNPFGTYLLPNMGMLVGASDNYFVKYLPLEYFGGINSLPKILNNNKSFLSNEDYQKLSDYRDDDNPILVYYKLK